MTITYQQPARVIVTAAAAQKQQPAAALAAELNLDYIPRYEDIQPGQYAYALVLTEHALGLQETAAKKFDPFTIDFSIGKMRYRSDEASIKRELLARALGAKPKDHPRIIDATAGLGRDSFILASLGFEITLLERSPVIFALLRDAVQRASVNSALAETAARMHLVHADARAWLAALPETDRPDIITLDPMFPARDKSASVKKEMVILQNVLEKDPDAGELLTIALACSKRRVVVKRPRLAQTLSPVEPSYTLKGKSSRFDIYLV